MAPAGPVVPEDLLAPVAPVDSEARADLAASGG
jgi:hypothetical protein